MNSSIFSSDSPPRRWLPTIVFVCVFFALMIPHELAVRRSEALYGLDRVAFNPPMSDNAKLDYFLTELRNGTKFSMYCVGTSECEFGLYPKILERALPEGVHGVYNLGLEGTSCIAGLEILRATGVHPAFLVVTVSPFDFTPTAVERGDKIVAHSREIMRAQGPLASPSPTPADIRVWLEGWTRDQVYGVLHAATPSHRRTLGQMLSLLSAGWDGSWKSGDLLRFLNNEEYRVPPGLYDNARYSVEYSEHGFRGLKLKWTVSRQQFDETMWAEVDAGARSKVLPAYREHGARYRQQALALLRDFQIDGAHIVLVRLPVYDRLRATEDETAFDADMRALAGEIGVPYVSLEIVPADFMSNPDNFRDAEHLHLDSSKIYSEMLAQHLKPWFAPRD